MKLAPPNFSGVLMNEEPVEAGSMVQRLLVDLSGEEIISAKIIRLWFLVEERERHSFSPYFRVTRDIIYVNTVSGSNRESLVNWWSASE